MRKIKNEKKWSRRDWEKKEVRAKHEGENEKLGKERNQGKRNTSRLLTEKREKEEALSGKRKRSND